MGRRNDHSREQIRNFALEAAAKIVAEQGLQGLTTRKVAATIGYTVGSLYLVFENLDDLILQVNARTLDDLYQLMNRIKQQTQQPESTIIALGHAYLNFATTQQHRWRTIFEHNLPGEHPKIPEWYEKKIFRLFKLVEEPLQQMLQTDDVHLCTRVAHALWGGVHGICILAVTGKLKVVGTEAVEHLMNELMSYYLTGLKTQHLSLPPEPPGG